MTKKILLLTALPFLFLGCSVGSTPQTPDATPSVQKVGDTTKSGTIVQLSGKYYLQQQGGAQPQPIDSYNINLSSYVNKQVTVTGQYSGDTLFVGKIQ